MEYKELCNKKNDYNEEEECITSKTLIDYFIASFKDSEPNFSFFESAIIFIGETVYGISNDQEFNSLANDFVFGGERELISHFNVCKQKIITQSNLISQCVLSLHNIKDSNVFECACYASTLNMSEYNEDFVSFVQTLVLNEENPLKYNGFGVVLNKVSKLIGKNDPTPLIVLIDFLMNEKSIFVCLDSILSIISSSEANEITMCTSDAMSRLIKNIKDVPKEYLPKALKCCYKAAQLSDISRFIADTLNLDDFCSLMQSEDESIYIGSLSVVCALYQQEDVFPSIHSTQAESAIFECLVEKPFNVKKIAAKAVTTAISNFNDSELELLIDNGVFDAICVYLEQIDPDLCIFALHFITFFIGKSEKCNEAVIEYEEQIRDISEIEASDENSQAIFSLSYFLVGEIERITCESD